MEEYDNVNHPKHYQPRFKSKVVECIDITRHMPFCIGNAFKYIWRAGSKGGPDKAEEDIQKAKWYLKDAAASHLFETFPDIETGNVLGELFDRLEDDSSTRFDMLRKIALCGTTAFSEEEWGALLEEAIKESEKGV